MLKRKWAIEILWWFVTSIAVVLILLPIILNTEGFVFYNLNIGFIALFITFTRWIFLWKTHPLARSRVFRYVLLIACIPVFIYSIGGLNDYTRFVDQENLSQFMEALSPEKQKAISRYIQNEFIFFGVGTVIGSILMPMRMLISNFRQRNRGTL